VTGNSGALPQRHEAMAQRVLREARNRGIQDQGEGVLGRGLELAMVPRLTRLQDDHHPAFLHPGRTVIILLQDTPERDPTLLAAAALVESDQGALRVGGAAIQEALGGEMAELVARVPLSPAEAPADVGEPMVDDQPLLEALLELPMELARVALAERLDHLRHLHLEEDPLRRRRMHREAEQIYAPLAHRVDPALARRYGWWCRMFARRHLPAV